MPSIIGINGKTATLKNQYWTRVLVSASAICGDGSVNYLVSATSSIAPNLLPDDSDVSLGLLTGIPFPPKSKDETFDIEVRINSGTQNLKSFQLVTQFDSNLIVATGCVVGDDWAQYDFACTRNNPSTEVLMIGAEEPSTVSGSSIHIATISFSVKTSFKILAHIETTVKVLTVGSDGTDVTKPEFVSDMTGSGDIALNGYSGKKRRRQLLEDGSVSEVLELEVAVLPSHLRSLLQDTVTEANCKGPDTCSGGVADGCKFGDVNGDCSFDVSDVLELKRAIMGKNYDATFDLQSYSVWQRQQMDPNLDFLRSGEIEYVSPDAADSLYLLHALSKKARFIDVTNNFLTYNPLNATDVLLDMEVKVYDERSEAATSDNTKVRFELGFEGGSDPSNRDAITSIGTRTSDYSSVGTIYEASDLWTAATDQRGVFRLVLKPPIFRDGSANWIGETGVGISIIIDTYNDFGKDDEYGQGGSGSTEEAQRIKVFYGSATPPLDTTFGGGFNPYVSFDLIGVDPVQAISLKDITIGDGEFNLVSSSDETASGFSTSVFSYNVYVNASTSSIQLLTFIDESLSCTSEQISSGETDNCFTTQAVTIDGSEASACSLLTCSYFSEISLGIGSKTVRVTVYSATSETFYMVNFIRPDVPTFSSVSLSKGQSQLNFSPKTFTYYLEYSYDNNGEGLSFTPKVNEATTGSAITFVSSGGYESTASFLSGSSQGIELSTTDTTGGDDADIIG